MKINDMGSKGDGLLVQLEDRDIKELRYSIVELKISSGLGCESHVKKWLLPFLEQLQAEEGKDENIS